jgi:hypothetical protein
MNTLVLLGIYVLVSLNGCVQAVRKWVRHEQRWTVVDWLWAVLYCLMLSLSTFMLVDTLMHPAQIKPVSGWQVWVSWFVVAAISLVTLDVLTRLGVKMGRRIRQVVR